MRTAGVILAAGAASRFGYKPKCLQRFCGQTILSHLIQSTQAAGVEPILLVLGHYADEILASVADLSDSISACLNTDPDRGQASSFRLGLESVSNRAERVLVMLSDQPLLEATHLRALLEIHDRVAREKDCVQPDNSAWPGNPVVFSGQAVAEILNEPAPYSGKDWQRDHPDRLLKWQTQELAYFADVDTPEDLRLLLARASPARAAQSHTGPLPQIPHGLRL